MNAQYTFRGRVIKKSTGEPITLGDVRVRMGTQRESRHGTKIAKLDTSGFFSVRVKDSMNVWIGVDCSLDGYAFKTVSYSDTLILFEVGPSCNEYNIESAKRDIKENKLLLLFNGTISDFPKSKEDEAFEKKYNIAYVNFFDTPQWTDCMRLYNREIGRFLDEKFGKSWRKEVKHQIQF